MARYSNEVIDEVRNSNDIVEVISQYLTLKRSGRNYFGLCPFHNEKSPSFSVSPDRQIFHCFGCNVGGDVFTFISKINGLTFFEALQMLAERANIQLPTLDNNADIAKEQFKRKVYKVNEFAAEFYHKKLYEPTSKLAQNYVKKRKLSNETLKEFKIGFSGKFNELYQALIKQGFKEPEILESGLVNKNEKGYIDRFRNRLMFPICDARGKYIGFGGRTLEEDKEVQKKVGKYINSSENSIFIKRRNLFGLNVARKCPETKKKLLVVEGYMDVISLHQRGIKNVVAPLGTALTEQQGYLLRNNTEKIILSFDSDSAGQNAIKKGIAILDKMGCDIRVLQMNGAKDPKNPKITIKDPDEYVLKLGSARFNNLVDKAISVIEFQAKTLEKELDLENANDKIKFLKEISKALAKIDSTIEREVYIEKLAKSYEISKEALYAEVNKIAYKKTNEVAKLNNRKKVISQTTLKNKKSVPESIKNRENAIISLLLSGENSIYEIIKQNIKIEDFQDETNKQIAAKLYEEYEKGNSNINNILNDMKEEEQSRVTKVMIDDLEITDKEKAIDDILNAYQKEKLNQRKFELIALIENEKDESKKKEYEVELRNIIISLVNVE